MRPSQWPALRRSQEKRMDQKPPIGARKAAIAVREYSCGSQFWEGLAHIGSLIGFWGLVAASASGPDGRIDHHPSGSRRSRPGAGTNQVRLMVLSGRLPDVVNAAAQRGRGGADHRAGRGASRALVASNPLR